MNCLRSQIGKWRSSGSLVPQNPGLTRTTAQWGKGNTSNTAAGGRVMNSVSRCQEKIPDPTDFGKQLVSLLRVIGSIMQTAFTAVRTVLTLVRRQFNPQ